MAILPVARLCLLLVRLRCTGVLSPARSHAQSPIYVSAPLVYLFFSRSLSPDSCHAAQRNRKAYHTALPQVKAARP